MKGSPQVPLFILPGKGKGTSRSSDLWASPSIEFAFVQEAQRVIRPTSHKQTASPRRLDPGTAKPNLDKNEKRGPPSDLVMVVQKAAAKNGTKSLCCIAEPIEPFLQQRRASVSIRGQKPPSECSSAPCNQSLPVTADPLQAKKRRDLHIGKLNIPQWRHQ